MPQSKSIHPIPLWCRWFGHRWHNSIPGIRMGYGEDRCVRRGCPGNSGHQFFNVLPRGWREGDEYVTPCSYPGCDAVRRFKIPDPVWSD